VPLAAALALAITPPAAANGRLVEEVAKGLDSPRHLEFGDRGDLFVAEAGEGSQAEPCFDSAEGFACVGATGAVTKVDRKGRQSRVASRLASYANKATGGGGIGPHGIAVIGNDTVIVTNGGPTAPDEEGPSTDIVTREEMIRENPVANLFGRILLLGPKGFPIPLADAYAFERDVNPDKVVGNPLVDTNPVDVEVDGLSLVYADAGGNALNRVNLLGRISNIALFPNQPLTQPFPIDMQAVPTAVEIGPDGHYYVGQLTGFPFPDGGANVYRVDRRTGAMTVFKGGFTNIMDLAFGRDGTLYVLEIDANGLFPPDNGSEGAIHAISKRGDERELKLPAGTLPMPGGITVGHDGLYVTINSAAKDEGKVIRIRAR
jgi:hypothetical protein